MKKSIYLGLTSLLIIETAVAQLPANPWDTTQFDAVIVKAVKEQPIEKDVPITSSATTSTIQETASADVAHITRQDDIRVNIPSIKYKPINADAEAPVFVPAIDSQGNSKTGIAVKSVNNLTIPDAVNEENNKPGSTATNNNSWRGSGQFGKLNYTGEVTTYGTAYGQEMLAPEVNNHNMKVMLQHLRDLGYKIPESYDTKFQNFIQNYADELRQTYNGLGHQNNPFDTMFSGFLDVVEEYSDLDMENLLFNSINLISRD